MNENNENLKPVAGLQPFRHFCMTIGELPASYLETMTYYEMLVWFTKYLGDTVIPTINNNAECIEELQNKYIQFTDDITEQQNTFETNITNQQNTYEEHITGLFNELQTFVNNYFDNLDVQEEINNKLDDMVEQGTLQEIISEYLNSIAIFGYDNVSSMKAATNLINGSFARTLGFYSVNDGGGALYKIRELQEGETADEKGIIAIGSNGIVAEIVLNESINVKQFGAYGDGTHDDSGVINYCLNLAKDTSILLYGTSMLSIQEVFIPNGKYLISTGLTTNSSKLIIRGEDSALIGDGTNNILTFDDYGHQVKLQDLTFGSCAKCLVFDLLKVDQSIVEIESCSFSDCTIAIDYDNASSMLLINNCHFRNCNQMIKSNQCDGLKVKNCWFADKVATNNEDVSFLLNSGSASFENCFFIPAGHTQTATDIAWFEMNSAIGDGTSLYINSCRISSEPGYKTLVNFKGTRTNESKKNTIEIMNCPYLSCGTQIIKCFTYLPNIKIENNNITATTSFITGGSNFKLRGGTCPAGAFFNNYVVFIKGNVTTNKDIYTISNDIADVIYSDKPINKYIDTSTTIEKYIGNYQFTAGNFRSPSFDIDISYYRTNTGSVGWNHIKGTISLYSSQNVLYANFTPSSKSRSGDDITITFKTDDGTTVTSGQQTLTLGQASVFADVYLEISVTGSKYEHLILNSLLK